MNAHEQNSVRESLSLFGIALLLAGVGALSAGEIHVPKGWRAR